MVSQIYPSELHLNKANTFDTEAVILDLHLFIYVGIVSTKTYDNDGDVPRSTSYAVHISQLIQLARAPSHVNGINTSNKLLTEKLFTQGYRYHKLRKTFSKFYC